MPTTAPTVSVISSMATRRLLGDLAGLCEREVGIALSLVSVGGVEAARRLRSGEPFDVAVLAADALEALAADGIVERGSVAPFARSPAAVAVPHGAPRPAACDADALRAFIAAFKTVGVSTGPSGRAVRALLAGWHLHEPAITIIEAPPGVPVARLLAGGECAIGFQQMSELVGEPGIDIVGPVPPAVLPETVFSAAVCRAARHERAAQFMNVLASSRVAPMIERHAMQPCF